MDSVIVQMMFQQDTQRTIKKEQLMTEQTDTWLYPFTGCAFGIFFAVLIGYCKKRNRRLKKIKIEDIENGNFSEIAGVKFLECPQCGQEIIIK